MEKAYKPVPLNTPSPMDQFSDTDSGLGISGINNDQSMPVIPSVQAMERIQKLQNTDVVCKYCGTSRNFDSVMFSTLGASSEICDDCV